MSSMFRLLEVGLLLLAVGSCGPKNVNSRWKPDPPTPVVPAPAVPEPRQDGRLPAGARPTRYHLELSVDPKQATFFGRVRIGVQIEKPTRVVVLHAKGPRVLVARISTAAAKQRASASGRRAAHSKQEQEELVLTVDQELPVGAAEIDLEYEAPYGSNLSGLYRVESDGKPYAFTQFEPTDARRAFPCFDEPGFKVPVDLTVTVPTGLSAVSNMPELRRRENLQSGLTSFEFRTSPPLPTYLVALAVGEFEIAEGARDPIPIRLIALPGKARLGQLALEAARTEIDLLGEYFGERYPYPKLDLVAVPEFGAGAMENPGLVTFREEMLLLDPEQASLDARRGLAGLMAHELAHQWFGNLVTLAWWDDLWLNEAFASWMGAKIVDQWKPEYGVPIERVAAKQWVMGLDSLSSARRIRQPVRSSSEALEAFDGITYVKGSAVLGMVESWIGPDAFRRGVRGYIARHRHGNATADHLFAALSEQSGKDVARVMSSFVDRSGVPTISLETSCRRVGPGRVAEKVTLTQSEYRPLGASKPGAPAAPWVLPVCLRGVGPSGETCVELDAPVSEQLLEGRACAEAPVLNADETGYYRYRLTRDSLRVFAKRRLAGLSTQERIGLIGNSWALVKSGELSPGDYWELLDALGSEDSHAVWEHVLTSLEEMNRALVTETSRPAFGKRVAKLVGPAARRLGWAARPGEPEATRLLRKTQLLALGSLGEDAWARDQARAVAERWLSDPKTVDGDLAEVALAVAARKGDAALFEKIVARVRSASSPQERVLAISGLTGFDEPVLVRRVLSLVLDGTLRGADLRYVFPPLFQRPRTAPVAYGWLTEHFDGLSAKLPTFVVGRFPWAAAGLCDAGRVEEARAFFQPRLARIEGADKHLAQAVEAGKLCAALHDGQSAALTRALGGSE